jgi:WD40 repeat protein
LIKTLTDWKANANRLAFSSDGRYLVSCLANGSDSECQVWSASANEKIATYHGHDNIVQTVAVSPDGQWVATSGGGDSEIHIWSLHKGTLHQRLRGLGGKILSVGFSSDGNSLAWGKGVNHQSLNANQRGPLEYRMNIPSSEDVSITALSEDADSHVIDGNESDFRRAQDSWGDWSLRTEHSPNHWYQSVLQIRHQDHLVASIERSALDGFIHRSYSFSPNGQYIVSGGMNGVLSIYNRQGEKLGDYRGHTMDILAVAISPDGRLLISGSADQTIRLWDLKSRENLLTLFHGSDNQWVAWTESGYYTASPNGEQMVSWYITGNLVEEVTTAALREQFHRPDMIADALHPSDFHRTVALAVKGEFAIKPKSDS